MPSIPPQLQQPIPPNCLIRLSPWRISCGLTVIIIVLLLAGVAGQLSKYLLNHDVVFGLVRLFNLDAEANVPTWYSSSLLLLCSALLGVIGQMKSLDYNPYATHWWFLAILFLCMSLDEAAGLHEMLTRPVRSATNASGFLYYAWVIPVAAAVLLIGLAYLRFLIALPHKTQRLFVLAGCIYVGSALGLEFFEGYWATVYGENNLTLRLTEAVEDAGEMFGLVVFLYALLSYIGTHFVEVRVQIDNVTVARSQ
jgi:hypothetical protein